MQSVIKKVINLLLKKVFKHDINELIYLDNLKYNISKINFPYKAKSALLSIISPEFDEPSKPNEFLINLSLEAMNYARTVDLEEICKRMKGPPFWPNIWPGEHYKLLVGLVLALEPKVFIEIGTGMGLGSLSIKKYLPKSSKLITFDIVPWNKYPDSILKSSDFDELFVQYIDDLCNFSNILKHKELIKSADIIFIDAAKDGVMEYILMDNLEKIKLKSDTILIFDDIRLWNMLGFWRNITYPKIDLTSFGHWSGTGVVQLIDQKE